MTEWNVRISPVWSCLVRIGTTISSGTFLVQTESQIPGYHAVLMCRYCMIYIWRHSFVKNPTAIQTLQIPDWSVTGTIKYSYCDIVGHVRQIRKIDKKHFWRWIGIQYFWNLSCSNGATAWFPIFTSSLLLSTFIMPNRYQIQIFPSHHWPKQGFIRSSYRCTIWEPGNG